MTVTGTASSHFTTAPKDFLSILDLTRSDLVRAARPCRRDEGQAAARLAVADGERAGGQARGLAVREAVAAHVVARSRLAVRELGGDTLHLAPEFARRRPRAVEGRRPQPRALGLGARDSHVRAGEGGHARVRCSIPPRDQRAHRRRAPVPGARGHADAARTLGKLPWPNAGLCRRRQQRRDVARPRGIDARHVGPPGFSSGIRTGRRHRRGRHDQFAGTARSYDVSPIHAPLSPTRTPSTPTYGRRWARRPRLKSAG